MSATARVTVAAAARELLALGKSPAEVCAALGKSPATLARAAYRDRDTATGRMMSREQRRRDGDRIRALERARDAKRQTRFDPRVSARERTPWGAFQMKGGGAGHVAVMDAAALRSPGTYLTTSPDVPPAIARAAALQACGHARDLADARELIATLGLPLEVLR